ALPDAGDLAADLGIRIVSDARAVGLGAELHRRGRPDEARRAAARADHRVGLGLDLVLEIDLAGEVALDRPDLDLDLADVVAVDELELLAATHDGGEDHGTEECAPHLGDRGIEQIIACELHRGTSARCGALAWSLRDPGP